MRASVEPRLAGIGFRRIPRRGKEVEVASLVGLGDVRRVQGAVPARIPGWRGSPRRAAPGELGRWHVHVQASLVDVEGDQVAVPYQRQRAARVRLWRDVQ